MLYMNCYQIDTNCYKLLWAMHNAKRGLAVWLHMNKNTYFNVRENSWKKIDDPVHAFNLMRFAKR